MNTTVLIVFGALIVGLIVWVIYGSKKRQWYKVYMANNDVMLLYRDLNERWWRTSDRYLRFKNEQGDEVTFPTNGHWVLMMESVRPDQVNNARMEIQKIKEKLAKE